MTGLVDQFGRTEEERNNLKALAEEINAEAAANWPVGGQSNDWLASKAQEITNTIYRGFDFVSMLPLLSTVTNEPLNGTVTLKETLGLRAFWLARDSYIEASNLESNTLDMPKDMVGFHVYESEEKLMTNFVETQQTLINLGIKRLDAAINLRVMSLFNEAVDASSDYYITGGGLSLAALDAAIREVRDESESTEVSIIGRETMTGQIVDLLTQDGAYGRFIPNMNEDFIRRGVLGTYRGANIITLNNYADDQRVPFFPANELYVVAKDSSRFAYFGPLMSKQYNELDNWYWHYLAKREFGGIVHHPERIRRIVDTDIQAYTKKISG